MEKHGFVYIWYDRKHKRYYIGCHFGTLDDGYICSSKWMRKSFKRRPQDFRRRILKSNIEKKLLGIEEEKWLSLIKEEELGKKYYNLKRHHHGPWTKPEETKRKLSEALKGNTPWNKGISTSKTTKEKLRIATLKQMNSMTTEERELHSIKSGRGAKWYTNGIEQKWVKVGEEIPVGWYLGRIKVSDTTKQKQKNSHLGKIPWNKGKKGLQIAWNKGLKG